MNHHNPVPAPVIPYSLNKTYAITILAVHLLALLVMVPWLFSWAALVTFLLGVHVFGQGITIGYHRLLTHRSFKTPKWVERVFAILGICSMEDTPARWVTVHRLHHVHSDETPDPHSPRVSFWWSHVGWLMYRNRQTHSLQGLEKFAKDLLRDPFYFRLEARPYFQFYYILGQVPAYFFFGMLLSLFFQPDMESMWGLSPMLSSAIRLGLSMVVWGAILRIVAVWHITWSVNSLSHMFGYRNYETGEDSTNNWFVALLSVGEGWHNNHHEDPSAATMQHRWWELDLSYYEIKFLELLGLASDITPIRQHRHSIHENAVASDSKA